MDSVTDKVLGKVVLFKDFVKRVNDNLGNITYKQSNSCLNGYYPRTVGICKYQGNILVAVAIDSTNNNKSNDRAARFVIKNRLEKILANDWDILPEEDGYTYVPEEYRSLLWDDPYTFKNLHGAIEPSLGLAALKSL